MVPATVGGDGDKPTTTNKQRMAYSKQNDKRGDIRGFVPFILTHNQQRVMDVMSDGQPHTATDIQQRAEVKDPRGTIRDLIANGAEISSAWSLRADGKGRCKVYSLSDGHCARWKAHKSLR